MKQKATILLLCMAACIWAEGKIWRVNNINGIAADFTTLQAAHDAASAGDTLHIEGSPDAYQGITVTKKLTFIGPGYFLGENPGLQAWVQSAKVGSLNFYVGSEGSSVMGIDFNGGSITVQANDIRIIKNKFSSPWNGQLDGSPGTIQIYSQSNNGSIPADNIFISQNFGVMISINNPSTSVLVTGNYIGTYAYSPGSAAVNMNDRATAVFQNNIFRRGVIDLNTASFFNNIIIEGSITGTANLFSNNLCNGTQLPNTNGNKLNVDMSTVFLLDGVSPDGQYKLKANSPAIGAGFGSTAAKRIDAGMYSGNTPYVVSGMPSMPAVYFFENQPVGSSSDPIDVSIKVRSAGN